MPTGALQGLNPARKVGSAPDNKGLNAYTIASAYGTALGKGDPVKLTTDGSLVKATNDTADAIGILHSVEYTDSTGQIHITSYWPASQVATNITALVMDDPNSTFLAKADGPIPIVVVGDIFALNLDAADSATRRSTVTVKCLAEITGDVDVSAASDLGEDVTGLDDADAFTIKTTAPGSSNTTITIAHGDDIDDLLADLNAVSGITASLTAAGYLNIVASDGYDLTLASTVGAPIADFFVATSFTNESEVVAASAGLVKVVSIPDRDGQVLEVVLVDHDLRDDG